MKVCPKCSFANDESFPTCVYCNAVLVDVPSIPSADPNHPEHEQKALAADRRAYADRQIRSAGIGYAIIITLTAATAGFVFNPLVLLLYAASAVLVTVAVSRGWAGQFTASFLQGLCSVLLIFGFGPIHPLIFFMLVGHVVAPAFLWHWVDMIHNANR
jgi:hypothetical protein